MKSISMILPKRTVYLRIVLQIIQWEKVLNPKLIIIIMEIIITAIVIIVAVIITKGIIVIVQETVKMIFSIFT